MRKALVGLIGANIQKSLSPLLHEDAFAAVGIRGHYHLMNLDGMPGRRLGELLDAARVIGFAGLNVTYPCKEAIVPLLDEISAEARQIGAVNTVTIDAGRRTIGHNTDRSGFRLSLEEGLGPDAAAGRTVVLVGAGGAGRAVALALVDLGAALLLVYDQDMRRSVALVADLMVHIGPGRCRALEALAPALAEAAGVVNATPIGMAGFAGIPVPIDMIESRHFVVDIVYTPLETELIREARAKGAQVVTGGGMCVHQAAEAFRLFTGQAPDIARMKRLFAGAVAERDKAMTTAA